MVLSYVMFVENVYSSNLKEVIPLFYKELNLFIVNLQYVFSQHNNIRKLMYYRNMFRLRRVIIMLNI